MRAVQYDLKGAKTAEEALDTAQMNWEASPVNMLTENGQSVPEHKAIVRSDNNAVIGVVGDRYTPIQNNFAFSFFDTICASHNATYDKAYIIDGGRKVILEATIDGGITIRKNDEVFRKIRLINTFDGSFPLSAQFWIWRKVCSNGLMGWAKENKCKIYHTKNGEARGAEALRVLAASAKYFDKFETTCKLLASKIMDKKTVDMFLKECFPTEGGTRQKNLVNKVVECYEAGKGTGKGTAWDVFNGFVEWIDHYRSADDETRLANAVLGAVSLKEAAFDSIVRLSKV